MLHITLFFNQASSRLLVPIGLSRSPETLLKQVSIARIVANGQLALQNVCCQLCRQSLLSVRSRFAPTSKSPVSGLQSECLRRAYSTFCERGYDPCIWYSAHLLDLILALSLACAFHILYVQRASYSETTRHLFGHIASLPCDCVRQGYA